MPVSIDRHTLALISIVGSSMDVVGAMYLAYDLLGGEHGPLRTLSRAVTYGLLFGVSYGIVLGPVFGLAVGLTHGYTLASELSRASRGKPKPGLLYDALMSAIRGAGFGVGTAHLYGITFGAVFGLLSTAGQIVAYRFGVRPTMDYQAVARPRLTRLQFLAAVNRTVGYTAAGFVSAWIAHQHAGALAVGLRAGLVIGLVTAIFSGCISFVEWAVDHVPEKGMGVFGVALILVGFALQSVQYWLVLLDVSVGP
jgi:hypothetical protein